MNRGFSNNFVQNFPEIALCWVSSEGFSQHHLLGEQNKTLKSSGCPFCLFVTHTTKMHVRHKYQEQYQERSAALAFTVSEAAFVFSCRHFTVCGA